MKIAYAAEATPNGYYRGVWPMTALERFFDHRARRLALEPERWTAADVDGIDVLFIHRMCDEPALRLARQAKANGAAVVWDDDDDVGSAITSVGVHKRLGKLTAERRVAETRRLLALADLVTTPSHHLAARFRELGAPHVEVIENHFPHEFLQSSSPPHEGLVIGWVAALEHQMDVDALPIRGVLQQLLDERPDVRVATIGLRLGLRSERYEHRGMIPFDQLTREIATFDIGIAPLSERDFNRARSNIKLKEYAAGGIPWLASPIGPYGEMGEKQGGRLVADDRWHEEITRLLDKPRERRKLAKNGRKWVAGQTLTQQAAAWETALNGAVSHALA